MTVGVKSPIPEGRPIPVGSKGIKLFRKRSEEENESPFTNT
jgi:hypothetical protein